MASYSVKSYQHSRVKSTSYQHSREDQDLVKVSVYVSVFLFTCHAVSLVAGVLGLLSFYLFN